MNCRARLVAVALLALVAGRGVAAPPARTDSGQFTIYCEDGNLRRQVASFAATTKEQTLALLGESDGWRRPIVVNILIDAPGAPAVKPATVRLVQSAAGVRFEIVAHVGSEPMDGNLQKHLIHAILLEFMYRRGIPQGDDFVDPPWWVEEGTVELLRRREGGPEPRFFRTLIETNKLPAIESFLAARPDELGPTALAVDRALAMCLLQLLIEQPDGRARLARLVRAWPESGGDSLGALGREFPALAGGAPALQKWWTLNLARLAAADRVLGLEATETDRQISALLEVEVTQADGTKRRFPVAEFESYLKIPGARDALAAQSRALVELSIRANVLLRPVLTEYVECLALLARGKTRGVQKRLAQAAELRTLVARRAEEIADYLNWFEATQMGSRSNAFDNYLRTANEVSEQEKRHTDPVARYLDQLEHEL
jgi:hypothetical protein